MESQTQNPEFRINPEKLHPCVYLVSFLIIIVIFWSFLSSSSSGRGGSSCSLPCLHLFSSFSILLSVTECCVYTQWATTCDFQQCGILTSVDSDQPVQHAFMVRSSKWCSVSSLTIIECSCDQQRLWSDCVYAQADLRLCWLRIPHCWKSHVIA